MLKGLIILCITVSHKKYFLIVQKKLDNRMGLEPTQHGFAIHWLNQFTYLLYNNYFKFIKIKLDFNLNGYYNSIQVRI